MPYFHFFWTDDSVEHLAEHGITQDNFEYVVCNPIKLGRSKSSGNLAAWGYTPDGRYIITVFEKIDPVTVLPVTAYEVSEPV